MTIWPATADNITHAAQHLRAGSLVSFPTETVYGLGADAENDHAVARIFAAKKRPSFNPLIVHLPDMDAVRRYAVLDDLSQKLANAFWPGPFTLVLPRRPDCSLSPLVSAGLDTVAIRVPRQPVARALLNAFKGPIAAPSANPSGAISPTLARHVADGFAGISPPPIAAILDGGPCDAGVESTIVQIRDGEIYLLRPGSITPADITAITGKDVHLPNEDDVENIIAPGQLKSHYAPRAAVRLNVTAPEDGEAYLAFGPHTPSASTVYRNLSPTGDLVEAAANLFAMLHDLDETQCRSIAVAPIPKEGLGLAINDRLARAAAPRPASSNHKDKAKAHG